MFFKLLISYLFFFSYIYANTINIALASNMSYSINEIKQEFLIKYPNVIIKTTISSSGKLYAQIKQGAPFDIFFSANMKFPKSLYEEEFAITKPKIYAKGTLSIFSKNKYDFSNNINILKNKKIKKIAIANPKTAPYGEATLEALQNSNLYEKVKHKLVYGYSISQTVSYILIATDIGFISTSSLYSKNMLKYKKNINWVEVDSKYYREIKQGIVVLKQAKNNILANNFYEFIFSKKAQKILKKYGYKIDE